MYEDFIKVLANIIKLAQGIATRREYDAQLVDLKRQLDLISQRFPSDTFGHEYHDRIHRWSLELSAYLKAPLPRRTAVASLCESAWVHELSGNKNPFPIPLVTIATIIIMYSFDEIDEVTTLINRVVRLELPDLLVAEHDGVIELLADVICDQQIMSRLESDTKSRIKERAALGASPALRAKYDRALRLDEESDEQ